MSVLIQLMPLWLQILRELNSSPGDVLAALQMQNSTCCVPRIWANRISRLTGICNKMQQTKQSVKKKLYKTNNLARWTVELKEEHLRNSFYLLLNFVLANESKSNIWVHQIDSYSSLTFLFCVHSILMIKQILMVGILNSTFSLGTTHFSWCFFAPLCAFWPGHFRCPAIGALVVVIPPTTWVTPATATTTTRGAFQMQMCLWCKCNFTKFYISQETATTRKEEKQRQCA